jgi:hypothetical protein
MDAFTPADEINLTESGFRIAFGVVDYNLRVPLKDNDFVRFQVFLEERKDLKIVKQTHLAFHECTQEDLGLFYTINDANADYA